ncbi:phosphotransferase [Marivirga sp. S37H4]|uniref:Phosphotransferase n=1 Tax=Marivirga aurantiaca TaxID=2802615 RepID=A0A934WWC9_9BACT|nr:phosphotransferase [Marivirga aurantiaca]MBK6264105.1 phosphotransferase [Marivirga aurantiaca]
MIHLSSDKAILEEYLKEKSFLQAGEIIRSVEIPGEGNMNFTLRIQTAARTFILKQSREYVEKYPQVAAPKERVLREADFYQLISEKPHLKAMMPDILGLDTENSVMILEDLGTGTDYTNLYQQGENIAENELLELIDFATRLHNSFSAASASKAIPNREMRALNHEHMYSYPYLEENGLDLDDILPGLQEASLAYKHNTDLKYEAQKLGEIYLQNGDKLLHGDYFPGSWLKTKSGIRIIDPEFCFFGPAEFEIGVTIAHLLMAEQPEMLIQKALDSYTTKAPLNEGLRKKFTAGEIIRRILGLAQLPLSIDLEKRIALLEKAKNDLLSN